MKKPSEIFETPEASGFSQVPKDYQEKTVELLLEIVEDTKNLVKEDVWTTHELREEFNKLLTTYGNARELQGVEEARQEAIKECMRELPDKKHIDPTASTTEDAAFADGVNSALALMRERLFAKLTKEI